MDELKNQASKIKREQEKQLDEMTKISLEQKSVNEIINTYERENRKLEEELWYKLNTGYLISFIYFMWEYS